MHGKAVAIEGERGVWWVMKPVGYAVVIIWFECGEEGLVVLGGGHG